MIKKSRRVDEPGDDGVAEQIYQTAHAKGS